MNQASTISNPFYRAALSLRDTYLLRSFFAGLLIPCGFAPFHLPGLAILGMALFFSQLRQQTLKQSIAIGFFFGFGFLGLGVSWIYVSIHEYGHLNAILSALVTLLFIIYLACYPALVALVYHKLAKKRSLLFTCVLFSALWCLGEYLRATTMGGFPWLLLGFGQIDTPLKYLLPIFGVFGVGFITCLCATLLAASTQLKGSVRYLWLFAFIALLIAPSLLKNKAWSTISSTPVSVAIIQPNLSIRDKWDEPLFWQLLQRYEDALGQLIGKKQLIVMPESAIPLPANYISDFIDTIDQKAKRMGSAVLLGMPRPTPANENAYYNTLTTLGSADGSYFKQQLVPFGEFIPEFMLRITNWLSIPVANMKPGKANQPLIRVQNHPVASLICYELAYPQLLRKQLPNAEWIVSISDDGWFGHSLAMYQQLQMAQVLSIQTGRFQVVANKDGLSSVIDTHGDLTASLPVFTSGILETTLYPATGASPWVYLGDLPILLVCLFVLFIACCASVMIRKPINTLI